MSEDFRGVILNEVTVIIENEKIGFSMNCRKDNKVIVFDAGYIPVELLKIIYERLKEETNVFIEGAVNVVKIESGINNIIQELEAEAKTE